MTTKDEIQTSINSRLTTPPTQIEGGTTQDIIGSVSYELANIIDTRIETILNNAFVSTADEEHLVIKGEELGITKKEATRAYVVAQITGAAPKMTVTKDVQAQTESGLVFQAVEETVADENGFATVKMQCLDEGSGGNIAAGTLNGFAEDYSGLQNAEITNPEAGYDGFDSEEVEEYRERILEYMRDDACNSNISDYIAWAKSVSGVKNVTVQDATLAGAGHVDVYISASDNAQVSDDLISAVEEKLKKEQIINASLSVYPLEYFEVDVSANITLEEGANITTVKAGFVENLEAYLNNRPSSVSYLLISNLLFETEGVADVSGYLLNNSTSSLSVGSLKVPVAGTISLTAI